MPAKQISEPIISVFLIFSFKIKNDRGIIIRGVVAMNAATAAAGRYCMAIIEIGTEMPINIIDPQRVV